MNLLDNQKDNSDLDLYTQTPEFQSLDKDQKILELSLRVPQELFTKNGEFSRELFFDFVKTHISADNAINPFRIEEGAIKFGGGLIPEEYDLFQESQTQEDIEEIDSKVQIINPFTEENEKVDLAEKIRLVRSKNRRMLISIDSGFLELTAETDLNPELSRLRFVTNYEELSFFISVAGKFSTKKGMTISRDGVEKNVNGLASMLIDTDELQEISQESKFEFLIELGTALTYVHEYGHAMTKSTVDSAVLSAETLDGLVERGFLPQMLRNANEDDQKKYLNEIIACSLEREYLKKELEDLGASKLAAIMAEPQGSLQKVEKRIAEYGLTYEQFVERVEFAKFFTEVIIVRNEDEGMPFITDNAAESLLNSLNIDIFYRSVYITPSQVLELVEILKDSKK